MSKEVFEKAIDLMAKDKEHLIDFDIETNEKFVSYCYLPDYANFTGDLIMEGENTQGHSKMGIILKVISKIGDKLIEHSTKDDLKGKDFTV